MTNQRILVLLVLKLTGLVIITADYQHDETPNTFRLQNGMYENNCLDRFEVMLKIATDNLQNHNLTELYTVMLKIAYDYSTCISEVTCSPETVDEISEESYSPENEDGKFMRQILLLEPVIPDALDEIASFHHKSDYPQALREMRYAVHKRLRDFVNSGLHTLDFQENHIILLKQMLYDLSEIMLSNKVVTKVEIIVDRRLNPYIFHKTLPGILGFARPFPRMSITEVITIFKIIGGSSQPYEFPDCRVVDIEPIMECVLAQITACVMLETMLSETQSARGFWDPLGDKLCHNLVLMLVEIIDRHHDEPVLIQRFGLPAKSYVDDIYKARASIIVCLDVMRLKEDIAGTENSTDPSLDKEIEKCVKSATDQAVETVYDVMLHAGVSDLEFEMIATLERGTVKKILREQMIYYAKLKYLTWFIDELLDDGILNEKENPRRSKAWEIVRRWEESSIEDPITRLAKVIGESSLVNITCSVPKPDLASDFEIAVDHCWKPILGDLLIIESAVRQDEVSLEIVFYGHPIIMNYVYVVGRMLSTSANHRV